jgi:hypothetical protein
MDPDFKMLGLRMDTALGKNAFAIRYANALRVVHKRLTGPLIYTSDG